MASVVFIAIYALALAVRGPMNGDLLWPFHRWELFSKVPSAERTNYSIRLIEVDGEPVDPPRYFDEAQGYVDQPNSPVATTLMGELGAGIRNGDLKQTVSAQMRLESRFMQGIGTARYEVVLRRFDILERRTCDCFLSEEVVATLEKKPPA